MERNNPLIEMAAKAIYDRFNCFPVDFGTGWVQWVPHGNSTMQDEARRCAIEAIALTASSFDALEPPPANMRVLLWVELAGEHVTDRSYWALGVWDGGAYRDGHDGGAFSHVTRWTHLPLAPDQVDRQFSAPSGGFNA